jgi:hypothetical protein
MNAHVRVASPLAVSDPEIRKLLQLAGLRFMCSRAQWLNDEGIRLGKSLKSGATTSEEVDLRLEEMGMLDLVYPELMMSSDYDWTYQHIQCWGADGRPKPKEQSKPEYRTPQATVDAFFGWIVRQDETTQARWLAEHPNDAPYLRKLWEEKCNPLSK